MQPSLKAAMVGCLLTTGWKRMARSSYVPQSTWNAIDFTPAMFGISSWICSSASRQGDPKFNITARFPVSAAGVFAATDPCYPFFRRQLASKRLQIRLVPP
jgi:hypothetical protein